MAVVINKQFLFFALAVWDKGYSGSDRIFIELAKNFSQSGYPVHIYTWERGKDICLREGVDASLIRIISVRKYLRLGFFLHYLIRIFLSVKLGFDLSISKQTKTVLYSSSDFLMDVIPCFIQKIKNRRIIWVAGWYQTAPNPLRGYNEGGIRSNTYILRAFIYWFSQQLVKPLLNRSADYILVNNEDERKRFSKLNMQKKVLVLLGAVNVKSILAWQKVHPLENKLYDAVFQGRFHPQKGVTELIEIWKLVVHKKHDAKLILIGDGPLRKKVEELINTYGLKNNVELKGYLFDGDEKYHIFSQSKIVVHPSFYDSGGMAAGEAMAFGLPCVAFNLKAYESYYPRGMIKVDQGDLNAFAVKILWLLEQPIERKKIGNEASQMITTNWSWSDRGEQLLKRII
jgi:glycosyltransferase involved in cell wall biosynthesis